MALSNAERQRRYRDRLKAAASQGQARQGELEALRTRIAELEAAKTELISLVEECRLAILAQLAVAGSSKPDDLSGGSQDLRRHVRDIRRLADEIREDCADEPSHGRHHYVDMAARRFLDTLDRKIAALDRAERYVT